MIWAVRPRSRLLCMNVSHLRVRFSVQADEEVERKFIVTPEIERRLLARCVPITRSFTDEYYDIEKSYDLSTKDLWLRRRDQTWELKWPMANTNISGLAGIDFYNESCDIKTISEVVLDCTNASALQTAGSSALTDWVSKGVLALFAEITTVRETYTVSLPATPSNSDSVSVSAADSASVFPTVHRFKAEIDRCNFAVRSLNGSTSEDMDNRSYRIGEIELIAAGGGMSQSQALEDVFCQLDIAHTSVRGKVLEFLYRHRPQHYAALGASGLLASKLGQQLHPQGSQPQPMHVNPSSIDRNSLASNGSKGFARRLLQGTAINIHFTRKCNFECKFCFHTAKTSFTLPLADLQQILTLCRLHGAEKVNFAGGEPFLKPYRYLLGELVKHCKEIGFDSVSIISNGSTSHSWRPWFVDYGKYLDILGISLDSADPLTNYSHGRWPRGLVFDASKAVDSKTNRGLISIRVAAKLASEFGVKFKVNTVVTKNNKDKSVAHVINELKPMRWKVFQVLPIVGENIAATQPLPAAQSQALPIATPSQATLGASGASVGGCASGNWDVKALLITDREFEQFLSLNRGLLDDVSVLVPENNSDMLSSYILIDEFGRFLDCSTGAKTPTSSIIDVGIEEASRELLENGTDHGGFDKEKFLDRGGYYPETWVRDSV